MADENDPDTLRGPSATPTGTTPSVAEHEHPADPSHSTRKPDQPVGVGARAIDRPTGTIDEAEGDAGTEDSLSERLAKKDNTPVDEGGSSSLA